MPIRRQFVQRHFKPAVESAGLTPLRWHDLRHTAAGIWIALGVHPKAVQEWMGHSSSQVTQDNYGHRYPNLDAALMEGLDDLARSAAADLPPANGHGAHGCLSLKPK